MSKPRFSAATDRNVSELKQRVTLLERWRRRRELSEVDEVVFSYPGPILAEESPPYRFRNGARLMQAYALLGTSDQTTALDIEIRKEGQPLGTIRLPAGEAWKPINLSASFGPDADVLTVATVNSPTGTANLTVMVRYRHINTGETTPLS